MSEFLTPKQVAERAQLSPHAVYRAIKRGDLEAREPVPGRLRISRAAFEEWMSTPPRSREERETSARPERKARVRSTGAGSLDRLQAIQGGRG